jgi:hypothetical protein
MNKKRLTAAVVALLVVGCSGSLIWGPGLTPSPIQTLLPETSLPPSQVPSPAVISPQAFLEEELYPLFVEFEELGYSMGETDVGALTPLIRRMADSLTALQEVDARRVPLCAKAGLSDAIRGEEIALTTWGNIAYECERVLWPACAILTKRIGT